MIRWSHPLLLWVLIACVPTAQQISPDSYAASVAGEYQGRLSQNGKEYPGHIVHLTAVSDSVVRVSYSEGQGDFLVSLSGPSATVLRLYYREEQIGTLIAGTLQFKRRFGLEYSAYFSGNQIKKREQ